MTKEELTKDDIIELAREAGLLSEDEAWVSLHQEAMERFAEKVRADEREACAAICRKEAAETDKHLSIVIEALEDCAYLIEKRGEK